MKRWPAAVILTVPLLFGGVFPAVLAQQTDAPWPAATAAASAPEPVMNNEPTEHEKAGRCVEGSEQSCMSLTRQGQDGKERKILVVRTGTSDSTGIYTICGAREEDPEGTPNVGVFSESGAGGIRITMDKNVIRVPLAIVTQRPAKNDQEGSDGRIEASAGQAKYLETAPEGASDRLLQCGVEVKPSPQPDTVLVTQGKTQLKGKQLVYDEADGIARIDGPISFTRDNEKEPLSGSSDRIEVNVDEETTLLIGNVKLTSKGGRVSTAGRVEYDDVANTARLYATPEQPATSVKGSDRLQMDSGYILYDLTNNDVVMQAESGSNITGEVQDSEDPQQAPADQKTP